MIDPTRYNLSEIHKYGVFDEYGSLAGIKNDAPKSVKDDYARLKTDQKKALADGEKL